MFIRQGRSVAGFNIFHLGKCFLTEIGGTKNKLIQEQSFLNAYIELLEGT